MFTYWQQTNTTTQVKVIPYPLSYLKELAVSVVYCDTWLMLTPTDSGTSSKVLADALHLRR